MAEVTRTIIINESVEKTFDFAKDLGKLWSCWPDVDLKDVTLTPQGVGTSARWSSSLLGIPFRGDIEFTEVVPPQRIVARSSTGPVFTFTFTPSDGGTAMTVDVVWRTEVPVVGGRIDDFLERWTQKDAEEWLENVKAAVEGTERPAEPEAGGVLVRSVTVDAPADRVFDVLADIGRLWVLFPDTAVRDVRRTPEVVGSSARMYSHWRGIHMEGTVEVVEAVRNERLAAQVVFRGESPVWTFTLAPEGDGTLLTAQGEWHVKVPRVGSRIEAMMAREHREGLEQLLDQVKRQAETDQA